MRLASAGNHERICASRRSTRLRLPRLFGYYFSFDQVERNCRHGRGRKRQVPITPVCLGIVETISREMPSMKMARVILFTGQIDAMSRFYGEVLGLKQVTSEKGWREFAAGGATIALHSGPSSPGRKGPKIVFHAKDVAALREKLVARGAKFGEVRQGPIFCLCDGKDPDGNPIQLSDR